MNYDKCMRKECKRCHNYDRCFKKKKEVCIDARDRRYMGNNNSEDRNKE